MKRRTWIITLSSLAAVLLVGTAIFATGPGAAHGRWAAKYGPGAPYWTGRPPISAT